MKWGIKIILTTVHHIGCDWCSMLLVLGREVSNKEDDYHSFMYDFCYCPFLLIEKKCLLSFSIFLLSTSELRASLTLALH